jgi:hypothetical protein
MTETAARNLVLTELPEAYPAIAEAREAGDVRLILTPDGGGTWAFFFVADDEAEGVFADQRGEEILGTCYVDRDARVQW